MIYFNTLEVLFWISSTIILLIICSSLVSRIHNLQINLSQKEWFFDTALRDLYDARFQFINLTIQGNSGALGYVYVLKSDSGHYKIGKTSDPNDRIKTFGVKLPMEIEYLVLIQSNSYHQLEARFHQQFKHKRINGEWFTLSPTDLMWLKSFPGNILKTESD